MAGLLVSQRTFADHAPAGFRDVGFRIPSAHTLVHISTSGTQHRLCSDISGRSTRTSSGEGEAIGPGVWLKGFNYGAGRHWR